MNKLNPLPGYLVIFAVLACQVTCASATGTSIETESFAILNSKVKYPTGLLCHKDTVSVIEGGNSQPYLTRLDFEGVLVSAHNLQVSNRDWQGLAQDEEFIYIADLGNTKGKRKDLSIYRMDKGFLGLVDNIQVNYENNLPENNFSHKHKFDAAAIALNDETLFIFSKSTQANGTYVYRLNVVEPEQTLNPFHILHSLPGPVTGAAFDTYIDKFYLVGSTVPAMEQDKPEPRGFIAILNDALMVESVHITSDFVSFSGVCVHENGLWLVQPKGKHAKSKLIHATFE